MSITLDVLDVNTGRRCPCDRLEQSTVPGPGGCVGRPEPGQDGPLSQAARTAV
ncbi:hypothetical protein [Cryptosporangium aurantiacum]|uniref:Uncharacterized protein n=1 Tax=Cryptosporangium aurantiacum TaxID=134849 RepID=A0A1M7QXI5_9ACTN|nr:hypothetical protein [Cryptosporangium aurantiacum]SHN36801.1 hypothetical protein SAMN05443668_105577 [Cryptosporangium aurantiacum]